MKHESGSVRMGPISLVSLVIILSLAVLTVLSITTSQAMYSSTKRQADSTADIYLCEVAGQEFLANVDEVLAGVREGEPSRESAIAALRDAGNSLLEGLTVSGISSAVEVASDEGADEVVSATFVTQGDRRLSVTLAVSDSATYRILSWKTTTFWNNYSTNDTLWSGETTD